MRQGHGPIQIASSLTVSKVAGDQSRRARRSPCAGSDVGANVPDCKRDYSDVTAMSNASKSVRCCGLKLSSEMIQTRATPFPRS